MNNPLINKNTQKYNSIPFEEIKSEHFLPAINHFIKISRDNIDKISNNDNLPDFNNTILALETSQEDLDYVTTAFQHLYGSEANDDIRKLVHDINPLLTELSNDISLNSKLFNKIKTSKLNHIIFQFCFNLSILWHFS